MQTYGVTVYHKLDDHCHISCEFYDEHQNGAPNADNPNVASGTPFSILNFNQPGLARCTTPAAIRCNAYAIGTVAYISYSWTR